MKNLLKNRKGFTLAEILLVVAIIAILSGATVIGVASWVNSSKQTAEQLTHNAADFEPGAYASVKAKKGTLPSYVEETETLNTGETEGTKKPEPSKEDPKPEPSKDDPKPADPTKNDPPQTTAPETTAESTRASSQQTAAPAQPASSGMSLPGGMEKVALNDSGWGGDATVKLTKDLTNAKSITIVVTTTDGGGFKEAWGINDTVISSDGNTITYTLNNGTSQWWTDPTFQKDGKFTVNYKFKDEKSHPVSIRVVVNN